MKFDAVTVLLLSSITLLDFVESNKNTHVMAGQVEESIINSAIDRRVNTHGGTKDDVLTAVTDNSTGGEQGQETKRQLKDRSCQPENYFCEWQEDCCPGLMCVYQYRKCM